MGSVFFERPILNPPYAHPGRHWELDADGQPTNRIVGTRRRCELISPIPKTKKRRSPTQIDLGVDRFASLAHDGQEYNPTPLIKTPIIKGIRREVKSWLRLPNPNAWGVRPETQRLLQH